MPQLTWRLDDLINRTSEEGKLLKIKQDVDKYHYNTKQSNFNSFGLSQTFMSEGLLDKPDILVRIIGKYYTKYQAESIAGRIPFEKFSDHNKMKGVNLAELKAIKFRPAGVSVGSSKEERQ